MCCAVLCGGLQVEQKYRTDSSQTSSACGVSAAGKVCIQRKCWQVFMLDLLHNVFCTRSLRQLLDACMHHDATGRQACMQVPSCSPPEKACAVLRMLVFLLCIMLKMQPQSGPC
jgi:hypothetical protein